MVMIHTIFMSVVNRYPDIIYTLCSTAQIWSGCTEYSSTVVNGHPAIYVILCIGEKNGKIKIVSSFPEIKLCFVINMLNNKTIIVLNLAEYPCSLVGLVSDGIPHDFARYC